jgi:hypothetical protein
MSQEKQEPGAVDSLTGQMETTRAPSDTPHTSSVSLKRNFVKYGPAQAAEDVLAESEHCLSLAESCKAANDQDGKWTWRRHGLLLQSLYCQLTPGESHDRTTTTS